MKLKSVQVKNFRCIEDSTEFSACPVTCLVGKNGAGKTSKARGRKRATAQ
ncbi:MAG: AAA family ATPase [Planctomycetes bacterium]|nr:AAA family ATPase [Planctomycetota bacterium]